MHAETYVVATGLNRHGAVLTLKKRKEKSAEVINLPEPGTSITIIAVRLKLLMKKMVPTPRNAVGLECSVLKDFPMFRFRFED